MTLGLSEGGQIWKWSNHDLILSTKGYYTICFFQRNFTSCGEVGIATTFPNWAKNDQ